MTDSFQTDAGKVSAMLARPPHARLLYVMAHGAGAGMHHRFMVDMVEALGERGIATFRYQFPYWERGSKRPDSPRVLTSTVRAAVMAATQAAPDLPLLAGGKSMGGRMTSLAQSEEPLPRVRGLAFLGFPLHAANAPDARRGVHLDRTDVPLLFLQGTRDALADLVLLRPLCERLGPRATLHVIDGADHSFHVTKSSGRSDREVLAELADALASWAATSSLVAS